MTEEPPAAEGYEDGDDEGEDEAPGLLLHAVDEVHAEERGNETLLSKLKFKLQIDELDADLIEDVNIEMTQARETTNIYSDILESTMDTYQSIINNNMNQVMRTLTSVTIIMMFPTLIASLFGMNLVNGMEEKPWGFIFALIISVLVSIGCWFIFRHKRLV